MMVAVAQAPDRIVVAHRTAKDRLSAVGYICPPPRQRACVGRYGGDLVPDCPLHGRRREVKVATID